MLYPKKYNDKVGYIDDDGNWIIEPKFDEGKKFSEGKAAVQLENRWGYIDEKGSLVIQPIFQDGFDFINGYALVKILRVWGYRNEKGEYISEPHLESSLSSKDLLKDQFVL